MTSGKTLEMLPAQGKLRAEETIFFVFSAIIISRVFANRFNIIQKSSTNAIQSSMAFDL